MSRSVNDRIHWFLTTKPPGVGMCLRHTWLATDLPYVGIPDANAGWAYVKGNGKLYPKDRKPPRGAWVWYASPTHGHVGISLGDGVIASTDVNGPATTGRVQLSYPETVWGHRYVGWSDWFGESFTVGDEDMPLSDADINRIARAVWEHGLENTTTEPQQKRPAGWFLNSILDKVKGKP